MTLTSWFPWHPGPPLPKAWLGGSSNLVRQCRSLIKHSFLSNLIQMSLMSVHTRSPTNEPQNQGARRGRLAGGHLEPQGPWTPPRLGAISTAAPFLTEGKGGGGSPGTASLPALLLLGLPPHLLGARTCSQGSALPSPHYHHLPVFCALRLGFSVLPTQSLGPRRHPQRSPFCDSDCLPTPALPLICHCTPRKRNPRGSLPPSFLRKWDEPRARRGPRGRRKQDSLARSKPAPGGCDGDGQCGLKRGSTKPESKTHGQLANRSMTTGQGGRLSPPDTASVLGWKSLSCGAVCAVWGVRQRPWPLRVTSWLKHSPAPELCA